MSLRELDSRRSDGITFTLAWSPENDRVFLIVDDDRARFDVVEVPPTDAGWILEHPYPYLAHVHA